jgi:hypothetical protein
LPYFSQSRYNGTHNAESMRKIKTLIQNIKRFVRRHKRLCISIGIILFIILLLAIYIIIGVIQTKKNIDKLKADVAYIKQEQNAKSFQGIITGLENTQPDIQAFHSNLHYFGPFKYVPIASGYYNNAVNVLDALSAIDAGAITIVKGASPIANSLGYGSAPINGSAKISAFVSGIPVLVPAVDAARTDFDQAQGYLNKVDPNYLPSITVSGVNIKNVYVQNKATFNNVVNFLPQIDSIAPVLEAALGAPTPQTYLMLFQNDKELRSTGGFITSYGYLNFNKGNLGEINTNDIYNLDPLETLDLPAPIQLEQYNAANRWYLRDSNTSPDVPTAAKQAEAFYNSVPLAYRKHINGVVYIDTQFVASLMDAVGPIYVTGYNQTVNSSNFAYYLEYYSEKDKPVAGSNRKQFINALLGQLKTKVFQAQRDQLVKLIQVGLNDFATKHIFIYGNNPVLESTLAKYNWAGAFPTPSNNDFFAMIEENLGGAKADFYIKRNVNISIAKTAKGYLQTDKITFTNNQVYDDWLNGPYTAWVRFYAPLGSKLNSIDNVNGTLREYNDLGYSVFDDHIRVPVKYQASAPAATLTVTLSYYLPSNFLIGNGVGMYVYKQDGVSDMQVKVNYNGNSQSSDITQDQTFSL